MEAQGDEGTVRHRRKLVVLGTALPVASEARHSGHRLAPTGKGLPTRDHGKVWEVGGGLGRHRRIGSRFDSGSLWDEHAYLDPAPGHRRRQQRDQRGEHVKAWEMLRLPW